MEDRNAQDTYIKDTNVEIVMAGSQQAGASEYKKDTDYVAIIIISFMILAIGAWGILAKLGILEPLFS